MNIIQFRRLELPVVSRFVNDQLHPRYRRFLISISSDQIHNGHTASHNSPIAINSVPLSDSASIFSPEYWVKFVRGQTSRIIQGATDSILTPVHWLLHLHRFWQVF
ncbi:unnamed protein product [Rotaria magnacalcarata]|nr:unnamed protein product [Rotaria magnacalcarata]CAF2046884.1 unnamed protein product [Rotaria magnacalcarata]